MAVKVTRAKRVAKRRVQNSGSAHAEAHDAAVLAQASVEDEHRPSDESIEGARRKLRLACDQLGFALAGARQSEDFDAVDNLTPVLASVWSARMELGDGPEVQP